MFLFYGSVHGQVFFFTVPWSFGGGGVHSPVKRYKAPSIYYIKFIDSIILFLYILTYFLSTNTMLLKVWSTDNVDPHSVLTVHDNISIEMERSHLETFIAIWHCCDIWVHGRHTWLRVFGWFSTHNELHMSWLVDLSGVVGPYYNYFKVNYSLTIHKYIKYRIYFFHWKII